MAEHKYTSIKDLLDASQTQLPTQPRRSGSGHELQEYPFLTDPFGELFIRESSSSSASPWDLFYPPLPKRNPSALEAVIDEDFNEIPQVDEADQGKTVKKKKAPAENWFDENANAFVREETMLPPQGGAMSATWIDETLDLNIPAVEEDGQDQEEDAEVMIISGTPDADVDSENEEP